MTDDEKSPLAQLAERAGWHTLDPPTDEQDRSERSIIGNWKGHPIRRGVEVKTVEESTDCLHKVFRTSKYDVHLRIESLGPDLAEGQIKVEEADGYNK